MIDLEGWEPRLRRKQRASRQRLTARQVCRDGDAAADISFAKARERAVDSTNTHCTLCASKQMCLARTTRKSRLVLSGWMLGCRAASAEAPTSELISFYRS